MAVCLSEIACIKIYTNTVEPLLSDPCGRVTIRSDNRMVGL